MYTLMVCDDEQIVIESVKHIVEKEFKNIRVIETARSGREAIEKTRTMRPDIILTDIKMPGISGLEAVKEIKRVHNDVKFVIVSVYEYFEYAKQAVELGVSEYLIKPVKKASLVETLTRIARQLDEERKKYDQELDTREKIGKMMTVVEHGFIYSFLLSQPHKTDIGRYKKDFFDMQNNSGYIFIMTFKKKGEHGGGKQLGDAAESEFYTYFKDALKCKSKCIVGPVMLDRVVVYMEQSVEDPYQQRVQAIACLEEIVNAMEKKYDMDFRVGIGKVHRDQDIMMSYQEALKALHCKEGGKILHIDDIAPGTSDDMFEILAVEHKLIEYIEAGDVQRCLTQLADIFRKFPDFFEQERLRYSIVEMMVAAHRIAIQSGMGDDSSLEYGQYLKQILNCRTKDEFEQMCIEKISLIAGKISINKKKAISNIIDRANKIIEERFNQELTLDEISKELCISPQYFSRLYKSEMGINFIEKLTEVRIRNAKKLMKETEHTVKEICFMSGYCDPNYFSRLFKKHEGVSPSEYLKRI
ncbi:MAG: response regulator [Clostridiales bacterium]|nr:response regulator [Clostridiales bacterium]